MKPRSEESVAASQPLTESSPGAQPRSLFKDTIRSLHGTDEALRRLRARLLETEWAEAAES